MAVTLVVEDGSIVDGANTYISLADVAAILDVDMRKSVAWAAVPDEATKNQLIAMATRYLEENYIWYGFKVMNTDDTIDSQPLSWPRSGMYDAEGVAIATTVIPEELKKAVAYLALWLYTNDGDAELLNESVKRFRSDEVEIEWQDGYQGKKAPEFLSKLLRPFGLGPNDRGFKPIRRV